jgi:hypothetical protein
MTIQPIRRATPPRPNAPQELPIVCAWCKQRERDGDSWGPRRTQARDDELSHGICPVCLQRELDRMKR